MAYKDFSEGTVSRLPTDAPASNFTNLPIEGSTVALPDAGFVRDAHLSREGVDLVIEGPNGTVIVEGYYTADPAPDLVAPDGSTLTPALVNSFTTGDARFAANNVASDVTPIGAVQEVSGHATVTHKDGTTETVAKGTPIYQGDIVETDAKGAVNIVFADQTSFAVSEDARLAIDEYVYDPATQAGSTDFSILKGVFVFTSGLIGRDDPDSVKIETPAGSIGIRGTIIAGNVTSGEITVVEGAIVLRDHNGNEVTLANQYETARFDTSGGGIDHMGELSARDVSARFTSVSVVAPTLFSSIGDSANEAAQGADDATATEQTEESSETQDEGEAPAVDVEGETPVETQTPLSPPPVMETNPFGPASLGGPDSLMPPPPPAGMMPPPPAAGFMPPPPPPPPPTNAGNNFNPPPPPPYDPNAGGTGNHAPVINFNNSAPPEFYMAAEGMVWNYRFDKNFGDADFIKGDILHYALDAATIGQLNSMVNDAGGPNLDILTAGQGVGIVGVSGDEGLGWSFNEINGDFTLFLNGGFSTTPGTATTLNLGVRAIDSAGLSSPMQNINFLAVDPLFYLGSTFTFTNDGAWGAVPTGPGSGTISSDNSQIIFGQANNNITIDNTGGGNTGSNNIVNVGGGNNIVTVAATAFDNKVIGGFDQDIFALRTARVKAYGMDGDDVFEFDATLSPNFQVELNTASSNTVIDGGGGDFRAGYVLRTVYGLNQTDGTIAQPNGGGLGDKLLLTNGMSIDFTSMPSQNKFLNIERIDMLSSTATETATLHYSDIFDMTSMNTRHTLLINVGNNDVLNLNGMAGMNLVRDNALIDNNATATGSTADDTAYDVYSNGQVTILIHNEGTGIINFDGTPTAVVTP